MAGVFYMITQKAFKRLLDRYIEFYKRHGLPRTEYTENVIYAIRLYNTNETFIRNFLKKYPIYLEYFI